MVPQLETKRLILRPFELADTGQVQELFPHWEIVRFLGDVVPWPYPPDGALTFYRDVALPAMARGEAWHWAILLKTNPGQLIGVITLRKTGDSNRGFWLGLPWHGQGLMTEAANAATDFWFNVLGFPEMRVFKAIANTASRRISESSGMRVVELIEKDYVGGRFPTEVWSIDADEWRKHRSSDP